MKFLSSHQTLVRGISAVRNAVGSPISNPIVDNIHISCSDGKICFLATNLNLTIRCEGEATVDEPGELLFPSNDIINVIQDLSDNDVKLETKEDNVRIECGKFKGKMKGQSAELFPPFVTVAEGQKLIIELKKLKEIIKKTTFAATVEKSRYELNGVKFDIKDGKMTCVSTDGRRLAVFEYLNENLKDIQLSALIPVKTLDEVVRILPEEGDAEIFITERKIQIKSKDITIISNLLMENFPQYQKIIPPDGDIKAIMKREELSAAIKRASNLTSVETNMVILRLEKGVVDIFGEREETGSEGRDQIDAEYEGELLEIRFNYKFVYDLMRILDEEKVEIELRDAKRPVVLRGYENNEFKYIIMPMRPPDIKKE